MVASQIRLKARENLTGNWGKACLLMLSFVAIEFLIGLVGAIFAFIPIVNFIYSIATIIISMPLIYGLFTSMIKLSRKQEVGYTDFLITGLHSIKDVWCIWGHILLKLIPLILVMLIFIGIMFFGLFGTFMGNLLFYALDVLAVIGYMITIILLIAKSFSYLLAYPLFYDHPDKPKKEIILESERLMQENRWRVFWLYLTFFGWMLLCAFTFGIGFLFLIPYILVSFVVFYDNLVMTKTGKQNENTMPEIIEEEGPTTRI